MKRLTVIAIIVVLLFTAACAETAGTEEFDLGISNEGIDSNDLSGKQVNMAFDICSESRILFYDAQTLFYDNLQERFSEIEHKYNCTVSTFNSHSDLVISSFYGGYNYADIYCGFDTQNFAKNMVLTPLNDYDFIDFTDYEKYGSPSLLEAGMFRGVPYGVAAARWPHGLNETQLGICLVVQEEFVKRYGLTDPRDIFENGDWVIEKLQDYVRGYYVDNGDDPVYGMATIPSHIVMGYLGAYGIPTVVEENGVLRIGCGLQRTVDAMNGVLDFKNAMDPFINVNVGYGSFEDVQNGHGVLTATGTNFLEGISANIDDFGLIPYPNSEYVRPGENLTYFSTSVLFSVIANADYPEADVSILSDLLEPINNDVDNREKYIDYLTQTVFFDRRDSAYYVKMMDFIDYAYLNLDFNAKLQGSVFTSSPSQLIQKYVETYDSMVEETAAENYAYKMYLYDLIGKKN